MSESVSSQILGTQQSPIDIILDTSIYTAFPESALHVTYKDVDNVSGEFKDANFEIDKGIRLTTVFRGKTYRLIKLHFHDACEHHVDRKASTSFEIHFLHQLEDSDQKLLSDKLAIGAFFQIKPNRSKVAARLGFRMISQNLKVQQAQKISRKTSRDVACPVLNLENVPLKDFIPDDLSQWFTYEGSLTTYPFTEDVTWLLIRRAEDVSKADVDFLIAHGAEQDHRSVQPLNRRFVLRNFEK